MFRVPARLGIVAVGISPGGIPGSDTIANAYLLGLEKQYQPTQGSVEMLLVAGLL